MPTIYSRNKETGGFEKVGMGNIAIPKKTSDLINDSGFIDEAAVDLKISEIPIPDVSAQIEAHNTSETAHDNIRSRMSQVEDRLDKITDNKVTNTLNVSEKAYITGTTSSSTNTGTQVFDTGVYLSDTPGELVATTFAGTLDGNAKSATSATNDASGNVITTTYETKSDASQKLLDAKNYTDDKIANLLDNSTEAVDSIFELKEAMEDNAEAIDALTQIAGTKASQSDFKGHVDNTTIHTNGSEKENWNAAYDHTSDTTVHINATERANWNAAYDHTGNKSNPHAVTLTQLGVTATAAELNTLDGITATVTELNYVDGVTSNIQTQLNNKMNKTNPTGTGSFSFNRKANTAIGNFSFAEGSLTTASGYASHAEGRSTTASGKHSHAEGNETIASGDYSHAEGQSTTASRSSSHAEGYGTFAIGTESHAEGRNSVAYEYYTHAEGCGGVIDTTITGGASATTYTLASSDDKIKIGQVIGYNGKFSKITAYDSSVPSITVLTTLSTEALSSVSAHIYRLTASGMYSHAEGYSTIASGSSSHAEGDETVASGGNSHAEGLRATASGGISHAEGSETVASGSFSHAEGTYSIASGNTSHAEGNNTVASGIVSHAEGSNTIASGKYSHVQGKYNIEDTNETYSHIVGNGTADNARSNAHTLDWSGNAWFAGGLSANGKMTQGSPSSDSSLASMNRFETDIFVEGNGSAPNNPTVPGFYLGKSASDGNRHLDIVSGDSFSYIDFNKGGRGADYDVRLLVNVENGETQFMWGDSTALTNRKFSVQGEIYQWGSPVALRSEIPTLSTESWTFTLEDGSTVTKAVYVG